MGSVVVAADSLHLVLAGSAHDVGVVLHRVLVLNKDRRGRLHDLLASVGEAEMVLRAGPLERARTAVATAESLVLHRALIDQYLVGLGTVQRGSYEHLIVVLVAHGGAEVEDLAGGIYSHRVLELLALHEA